MKQSTVASFKNLPSQATRRAFRGIALFANGEKRQYVATWPRKRGKNGTAAQIAAREEFALLAKSAIDMTDQERVAAMAIAAGTNWTWRDVLTRALNGRLIDLENWYMVAVPFVLDSISDVVGAMLIRTTDGWVGLLPSDDGKVLQLVSGLPAWESFSGLPDDLTITTNTMSDGGVDFINTNPQDPDATINGFWFFQRMADTSNAPLANWWGNTDFSELDFKPGTGYLYSDTTTYGIGTNSAIPITFSPNNVLVATLHPSGDWEVGAPTGGAMGAGSLNAQALYVNGNPVVTEVDTTGAIDGGPITGTGTIGLKAIANASILANTSGGSARPVEHTLSAVLDSIFSNSEGAILQRGASAWEALSPGSAGDLLKSGGASALAAWSSVSGIIDSAFSSTQGAILYRGASAWTALAPGSNGQALITAGGSANPFWGSVGGGSGGALTLLAQVSASGSSGNIQVTGLSGYSVYEFEFRNIVPATNAVKLTLQMLSGSGPTLENTAATYSYGAGIQGPTFSTTGGSDSTTGVVMGVNTLFSNVTSGIGKGLSGKLSIRGDGTNYYGTAQYCQRASDGHFYQGLTSFSFNHAVTITGIRFTPDSGNIASGDIDAYGRAF